MLWPKKIHTRNLITKKNSCGSKISLPPHNFSNGPSLTRCCKQFADIYCRRIRQLSYILSIVLYCPISANMNSKGTKQIPCFTVGQEKRNFGSKSITESTQCCICILNPCFVNLRVNFWY